MKKNSIRFARLPARVSTVLILAGISLGLFSVGCRPNSQPTEASQDKTAMEPTKKPAVTLTERLRLISQRSQKQFVKSDVCKECHQDEHSSWHQTYHRTMTQQVSKDSVLGNFDGKMTQVAGYPLQPFTRDGKYYMILPHPTWIDQELASERDPRDTAQPPPITYQIDLLIGSHHQQVYASRGPDGAFHTLPIVWDRVHERWITRGSSFMTMEETHLFHMTKTWNNGCVFCHNTGPDPGLKVIPSPDGSVSYEWDSEVEEFGIACEACHGPGGQHVALHRLLDEHPEQAKELRDSADLVQHIVNPQELDKEHSVLVCSRCHGKMGAKQELDRSCLVNGDFFDPRDKQYPRSYDHPSLNPDAEFEEEEQGNYFWSDGTPRTTALEYQGILLSKCYQQGEMTCVSCHGMHGTDSNDQLLYGDSTDLEIAHQNQACTQCHTELENEAELAAHSHHGPTSSGSLCYNCHMPYQAYALMKRVRSHRIMNPSSQQTAEHGIPNACNQCHVDQSLSWTQATLADWSQNEETSLPPGDWQASQVVKDLLTGHALQRALAIEQLGDTTNFELAGSDWRVPLLIVGLEDDYAVVRSLAYDALRRMDDFAEFQFDFIAKPTTRATQIQNARQSWLALADEATLIRLAELLGSGDEAPDALMEKWLSMRKNPRLHILE